jgi:hypothetical protein
MKIYAKHENLFQYSPWYWEMLNRVGDLQYVGSKEKHTQLGEGQLHPCLKQGIDFEKG